MGDETQINSNPSSSSTTPLVSSSQLPNVVTRESKKFRPPVSIFDLPFSPKCAPPQDDKSFFDRMDSIERALEEEDAGKIPKALEAGPEIIVESLNKKRRRIQTVEDVPLVFPHPPPLSSPSLSSSSSGNLPNSFSSVSSDIPSINEHLPEDNQGSNSHTSKKVRFRGNVDYRYIEARPPPSIRRSSRLAIIKRRASHRRNHRSNTSSDSSSAKILTPQMMYQGDDDRKLEDWLNGNTPPPPLLPSIMQQSGSVTSEGPHFKRGNEISERHDTFSFQYIEREFYSDRDETRIEEYEAVLSPNHDSEEHTHFLQEDEDEDEDGKEDEEDEDVEVENEDENLGIDFEDQSNSVDRSEGDVGDESPSRSYIDNGESDVQDSEKIVESNNLVAQNVFKSPVSLSGSLEIISVESSKESEELSLNIEDESDDDGNNNDGNNKESNEDNYNEITISNVLGPDIAVIPKTSTLRVNDPIILVDAPSRSNGSDGSSLVNFPEVPEVATMRGPGRPKKGKEVAVTSIASMIGSRRKHNATFMPSRGSELNSSTREVQSTNSVICLDLEDETVDSTAEASTKISLNLTNITPSRMSEAQVPLQQRSLAEKGKLDPTSPESPKAKTTPLSQLMLYVIPTNMNSHVFNITRKRVVDLGGSWLGPKVKTLATDPRAKPDIPALDQDKTTHIVAALTSIEDVKRFLNVDEINPKISVVNRDWLSDSIMYKTPMEPQGYSLRKVEPVAPFAPLQDETPPHSQEHTNRPGTSQQTQESKWFPKFKSTETGDQIEFNDIVQGIQEGSLDDPELSDIGDDEVIKEHPQGDGENLDGCGEGAGIQVSEGASKPKESSDNTKQILGDSVLEELTAEKKKELKHENRCFRCKEIGHWANRCPVPKPKPKDDEVLLQIINSGKSEGKRRKILYQCQSPHVASKKEQSKYNRAILEQLKILMDHYDTTKTKGSNEHFKVINYRKAITAIRSLDYEITSEEMALKIPRVGKKIAQKIGECVALGKIKKLDHLNWDKERSEVEKLFRSVYGVGSEKATEWYNKGLRTLDDLRKQKDLTKNQISGLRFHDDLLKRIPRAEVEEIGKIVDETAKSLHTDIQSQVTGSYRRGKPDCGDIDIVVARPNVDDGDVLYAIMEHILNELTNQGFLVDHLSWPTWSDEMTNQPKHFKYMGICRLPGDDQIHRHIDILVVPWTHHGAVLLYFTGNDICNRSMRLFASKKGMHLSDKGLFAGTIRGPKRERISRGHWVAGRTEREIFEYLGIDYLEPYEREC
ncbi:hypothetical protein BGZ46_006994 [Entomortierella lignicola]|nr:hypothetical protein BGZ46_006994 [Entomortierella lignicola]